LVLYIGITVLTLHIRKGNFEHETFMANQTNHVYGQAIASGIINRNCSYIYVDRVIYLDCTYYMLLENAIDA